MSVQTIPEIATGMLARYSSPRVAAEMAHMHAMDYPEGDPRRVRWLAIREAILREQDDAQGSTGR